MVNNDYLIISLRCRPGFLKHADASLEINMLTPSKICASFALVLSAAVTIDAQFMAAQFDVPHMGPMMTGGMVGGFGMPMGPMMGPPMMGGGMFGNPQIPPAMPPVAPPALGPVVGPSGVTPVPPQIPLLTIGMVEKDTDEIRAAIMGAGTDEKTLVRIITTRSPAQMEQIRGTYDAKFGSLVLDIKKDTSFNFENVLLSTIFHRWEFEAHWLRRSIAGWVGLYICLCTFSNFI